MASLLLRTRGCHALRMRFPVQLGSKITTASPSLQAYQAQRSLTNTAILRNATPRSPRVRTKYDSRGVSKPAPPSSPSPPPPPTQETYTVLGGQETTIATGNLTVGGIIGVCATIFVYHIYNARQYQSNLPEMSQKAKKRIESFTKHMFLSLRNWEEGRWWTTITSAFTHVGLFHFGANMFGVWFLGRGLCGLLGPASFSLIYLGSGIAGNLLQLYVLTGSEYID
ncbi:hypothetical protein B0J14DRAFT_13963 [Halenospora varia]|nr:hypothetical protein B0J14DRAFT_13963 [Halenospora varia]